MAGPKQRGESSVQRGSSTTSKRQRQEDEPLVSNVDITKRLRQYEGDHESVETSVPPRPANMTPKPPSTTRKGKEKATSVATKPEAAGVMPAKSESELPIYIPPGTINFVRNTTVDIAHTATSGSSS
jgi:hypothetical protein